MQLGRFAYPPLSLWSFNGKTWILIRVSVAAVVTGTAWEEQKVLPPELSGGDKKQSSPSKGPTRKDPASDAAKSGVRLISQPCSEGRAGEILAHRAKRGAKIKQGRVA